MAERALRAPEVGLRSSVRDRTLSGGVARMQVLRRVWRSFPKVPQAALDEPAEEVLTP